MVRFDCFPGVAFVSALLLNAMASSANADPKKCSSTWKDATDKWIYLSTYSGKDVHHCPDLEGAIAYGIFIAVSRLEQKCQGNELRQTFTPKFARCLFPDGSEIFPTGTYPITVSDKNGRHCVSNAAFHDDMGKEELRFERRRRLCGQCIHRQLKAVVKTAC